MISRRNLLLQLPAFSAATRAWAQPFATPEPWAEKLIAAAESQVGVTLTYDPAYVRLDYPGGDVPRERGVCTDVVIRAYRDGLGLDLQKLVHEDMRANFSRYPKRWGLKRPDRNIDHRRVPNLQAFFERRGAGLAISKSALDYTPGNLVTWRLPHSLPHIGIVTHHASAYGSRPLIVHNIGQVYRDTWNRGAATVRDWPGNCWIVRADQAVAGEMPVKGGLGRCDSWKGVATDGLAAPTKLSH